MNNIFKVTKYQLRDFRKAVGIFYLVIAVLAIIWLISVATNTVQGESNFAGASVIFIFILGLNSFKNSFKFTHANNVSRKRFYLGNILAIITVSLFMASIDTILTSIFTGIGSYKSIFQQIYRNSSFIDDFIWSFTLLVLATNIGWFITMLYYRCNTTMKIVISIVPVVIIIISSYMLGVSDPSVISSIARFLGVIFGVTKNLNPYNAVLTFIIGSIITLGLSYLLIRRAPIKD